MRSKGLLFLLISFFFVKTTQSQSNELIIKGQTGKLYLEHTVVPKENWYSIGRLYNISPKEIAPFNNLTLDKSLSIGQQLQIPLTAVNFSQNGQKTAAETLVPVYYVIQEKEWMYRISVNHNKVPIPDLEKWNNINGDQVKAGLHLIVGFLKVKTALSALANGAGSGAVAGAPQNSAGVTKAPGAANAPVAVSGQKASTEQSASGSQGASGNKTTTGNTVAAGNSASTAGGNATTGSGLPVTTTVPSAVTAAPAASAPTPAAPVPAAPSSVSAVSKPATDVHAAINFNGGYFKAEFSDGGKSVNGLAGTFKSTSGWQDWKYYALMNNVPVGTIVKITLPATNKSICAKILGQLPDMKESAGLTVRISNAGAAELGGGDGRFTVEVRY
jgi:LysM repeat protein